MHAAPWPTLPGAAPQRRAVGLSLVLALHAGLAWLLLGSGHSQRSVAPVRDSVQVVLLDLPQFSAPPQALAATTVARVRVTPAPVTLRSLATPATPAAPSNPAVAPAPALPEPTHATQAAQPNPATALQNTTQSSLPSRDFTQASTNSTSVPGASAQRSALAPATPSPTARNVGDLCPGLVKAVPPPRAVRAGLGGTVLARATVRSGRVVQVDIVRSEPFGLFDAAVRQAMMQYRCHDQGEAEAVAEQLFEFKLAD